MDIFDIYMLAICVVFVFVLCAMFSKHKKSQNGMNATTIAEVENVDVSNRIELEEDPVSSELRRRRYDEYSFTYIYKVNGVTYRGYGHSCSRLKRKIKIYYNTAHPEKSQTAERHNYYLRQFISLFVVFVLVILVCVALVFIDKN